MSADSSRTRSIDVYPGDLLMPPDLVMAESARLRLHRQFELLPLGVIGVCAPVQTLRPGETSRGVAVRSASSPLSRTSLETLTEWTGAILCREPLQVSVEPTVLRFVASDWLVDGGAVVHDPNSVGPVGPAAISGRPMFGRRPLVFLVVPSGSPAVANDMRAMANSLLRRGVEARLAGADVPDGHHLTRAVLADDASVDILRPNIFVTASDAEATWAVGQVGRRGEGKTLSWDDVGVLNADTLIAMVHRASSSPDRVKILRGLDLPDASSDDEPTVDVASTRPVGVRYVYALGNYSEAGARLLQSIDAAVSHAGAVFSHSEDPDRFSVSDALIVPALTADLRCHAAVERQRAAGLPVVVECAGAVQTLGRSRFRAMWNELPTVVPGVIALVGDSEQEGWLRSKGVATFQPPWLLPSDRRADLLRAAAQGQSSASSLAWVVDDDSDPSTRSIWAQVLPAVSARLGLTLVFHGDADILADAEVPQVAGVELLAHPPTLGEMSTWAGVIWSPPRAGCEGVGDPSLFWDAGMLGVQTMVLAPDVPATPQALGVVALIADVDAATSALLSHLDPTTAFERRLDRRRLVAEVTHDDTITRAARRFWSLLRSMPDAGADT